MLKEMTSTCLFSSNFVLISLLFMTINPSHSSFELKDENAMQGEKVNMSLYYEALCPSCENFIVNNLMDLFIYDLISIVNLHLVPYGNALRDHNNSTIICQHGRLECYYNSIEACALDAWPLDLSFLFIHCVETRLQQHQDTTVWVSCCKDLKLNREPIQRCHISGRGKELLLHNGYETDGLNPRREYVPWVTLNDTPIRKDSTNFINHICNAYKGDPKPKVCNNKATSSTDKTSSTQPVCYAHDKEGVST